MGRLTKMNKFTGSWTQFGDKYIPAHNIKHKECVNKLGQLEDIEEELGIDLITKDRVERAETIYHKYNGEMKICAWFRTHIYLEINGNWSNYSLEYKDYGKTWALTKEELEKK